VLIGAVANTPHAEQWLREYYRVFFRQDRPLVKNDG